MNADQPEFGHDDEVVQLAREPEFGAMRGEIEWQQGWEKPMTPEEADAFWEGR
jgi:hypothetical protein